MQSFSLHALLCQNTKITNNKNHFLPQLFSSGLLRHTILPLLGGRGQKRGEFGPSGRQRRPGYGEGGTQRQIQCWLNVRIYDRGESGA